jgi:hypothetical protein
VGSKLNQWLAQKVNGEKCCQVVHKVHSFMNFSFYLCCEQEYFCENFMNFLKTNKWTNKMEAFYSQSNFLKLGKHLAINDDMRICRECSSAIVGSRSSRTLHETNGCSVRQFRNCNNVGCPNSVCFFAKKNCTFYWQVIIHSSHVVQNYTSHDVEVQLLQNPALTQVTSPALQVWKLRRS